MGTAGFSGVGSGFAAVLLCCAVGCERPQAVAAPPPPEVTVAIPLQQDVVAWDEYTGRLDAVESVDVRPRVTGFIESAPFTEGSLVKQGDVLFVIDVRPFQAKLDQARADLQASQAQLDYSQANFKRYERLRPEDAASQLEYEDAKRALKEAEASIASNQAKVDAASLDVEWCRVTAPIAGRISRKNVTPGNLVTGGGGESTLLTTIVSYDPIYCYFDVDERSVLRYQALARQQKRSGDLATAKIPVYLALAGEQGFPHQGVLDFVDNAIDPGTGTMRVRGVFVNPGAIFTPGFYAHLRVPGSPRYTALLLPDAAIGTDQSDRFVLVVDDGGTAQRRPVQIGSLFGPMRVIHSGLKPDDQVVVNGLLRARPGTKVSVQQSVLEPLPPHTDSPGAGEGAPTTQPLEFEQFDESAAAPMSGARS